MNQSELEHDNGMTFIPERIQILVVGDKRGKTQREKIKRDFGLTSHWLIKWRELF